MRSRSSTSQLLSLGFALLCSVVMLGCQTAQLAAYTKYNSDADVPRISLDDAKKDFDAGTAVIIDARSDSQYDQEHIAGSMASSKIGPIEDNYPNIPKGKKIIVYCSWPNEHSSASLAFQLNQHGYSGTFALLGGTAAWKSAGYPMESNKPAPANE